MCLLGASEATSFSNRGCERSGRLQAARGFFPLPFRRYRLPIRNTTSASFGGARRASASSGRAASYSRFPQ